MLFVVYFCTAFLATAECYIITGSDSKSQDGSGHNNIKYSYGYGIHYDDTGDFKGQTEERDGEIIKGEYHVNDPDGYIRTVRYTVGKNTGFQAKVTRVKNDHHKFDMKTKIETNQTIQKQVKFDSEDSPSTDSKILESDAPKKLELNTGELLVAQGPSFPAFKSLEQFEGASLEEPVTKASPLYRLRDVHPRRYHKRQNRQQQFLIWYPNEDGESR